MSCARKALKLEALRTLQNNFQFQCHSLTKPRLLFQDSDKIYYKIIRCYDHTAMTTNGDSFTVLHCLLLLLAKTQLQNIMVVSRIMYSEHAWQTRAQKVWNRREYTEPAGSGSLVHGTPQMTSWHTWWKMGGASGIELNSRQAQRLATTDLSSNRLNFGLPSVVCLRCAVSTRNLNKPGELCKVPRTLNIEPKYGETRRSKYDNTVHVCVSEFIGLLSHTKPPGVLKVRRTDWSPPGL